MFANYVKIRPPHGDLRARAGGVRSPGSHASGSGPQFSMDLATYPGEHPGGHTFLHRDGETDYIYYCSPYPLVRVPADPERWPTPKPARPSPACEPGTRFEQRKLDRGADGELALRLEEEHPARQPAAAGASWSRRAGSSPTRPCSTSATSTPARPSWPTAARSTGTTTEAAG